MSELPNGWEVVALADIADLIRGVTYKKAESSNVKMDGLLPVIRANNIQNGHLYLDDLVYVPEQKISEKQKIKEGDIVIAMSSGSKNLVGKSARANAPWNGGFGAFCGLLRPNQQLYNNYVSWFTYSREYRNKVSELSAGVNINNLKPAHFKEINLPVAPLNEQIRIANKLDSLLGKLEATQKRLDKIPTLLKRFRQSVLAAATSGKLSDNKQSWDSKQIHDVIATGPQNGIYKPSNLYGSGTKIIRIDGFYDGELQDWGSFKRVVVSEQELEKWKLNVNDILINRVNSIEYLGKCGLVRELPEDAIFESNIMRISLKSNVLPEYLKIYLTSPVGIKHLRENAKHAVNQASINQTDVKSCKIELPHIQEQKQIVQRVESLFKLADKVEQQYQAAKQRTDKLTQSILAKAFRGELVPQDPNDEPASELLKRIKESRA